MQIRTTVTALKPYLIAVGTIVAALLVKALFEGHVGLSRPFGFFFSAIIVSGWLGGLTSGLTATFLGCVLGWYSLSHGPEIVMGPEHSTSRVLMFASNAVLVSILFGIVNRSLAKLKIAQNLIYKRESELTLAHQEASDANLAKSRLLANVSHEIRTPLGAILGFAQLMKNPGQSATEREECLSTILRNGDQLSKIISDILDLSKIESEKMEIESIPVSPLEILHDVLASLRLPAAEKSLQMSTETIGVIPNFILTDPLRLRQALMNVIGNSVKFTASGSVKVAVRAEDDGNHVRLRFTIRDTGCGISLGEAARLFQPFSQADASTTRNFGGTGLGLVLTQHLVRAMGGDLQLLHSEIGQGSTFEFTIDGGPKIEALDLGERRSNADPTIGPVNEGAGAGLTLTSQDVLNKKFAFESRRESLSGMNALLVEDTADIRLLVKRYLNDTGLNLEFAENGTAGVDLALQNEYDVILMDIQMPGLDGFGAVDQLRRQQYKKPIVALTAHAMKGDREKCLNAGFDGYLVKPVDRNRLIETIATFKSN